MLEFVVPLFFVLCALQVADVVLTIKALEKGATEANPIAKVAMEKLGKLPGLAVVKIPPMVVLGWFVFSTGPSEVLLAVEVLLVALFLFVVVNNIRQLKRAD